ncbi:hypothetical protein LCGC14_2643020, partial [marine sediment metagenome]
KVFGFITLSYWLCLAPVLIDLAIAAGILGLAGMSMMSQEGLSLKDLRAALRGKPGVGKTGSDKKPRIRL